MSKSNFLPFLLLSTSSLLCASEPEKATTLDALVVSAGPDAKTAFDLAQGTSVLTGEELRRRAQGTLGETLAATPGVSSTYYGPGASRPVIRGLGGDRIRVLSDGTGTLDASNISPDHNTTLEPLFASRIEVLRGPSTLLYGGSAVGGVVNVIDNRIPDTAPDGSLHGAVEGRGFGAANERAAIASIGGGKNNFAIQVDALKQATDDVRIPGGTLASSATETWNGSLGASAFWSAGHAGLALSDYETSYGVPTGDVPPTSINMKQKRLDFAGELTSPFGVFRGAKARLGYADYHHAELSGGSQVNTVFKNRAWEGRVELPHVAIGELTGTLGAQAARSDFSTAGTEVVTPPALTQSAAVFGLEELKLSAQTSLQFGARYDTQGIELGAVDANLPRLPGYAARSGQKKTFGGASLSAGLITHPAKDWSLGASLAYTERLPTAQELFSNGPHGGTGAYEVGTSGLGNEKSLGLDVNLRKRAGFVTGSLGLFVNKFSHFIHEQELPAGAIPVANNPDALTPYQFVAKDALFRGAEAELTFHLVDRDDWRLHLDLGADTVRADQTSDHAPLPRIPPHRVSAGLRFENERLTLLAEVRDVAAQDRIAAPETRTPGYDLVNASVSWQVAADAHTRCEFFARGNNLTNQVARMHSSFLKDSAPLPGRGVSAGVRVSF